MISAGTVEIYRLKHKESVSNSSSLSIFWQVLQYMMIRCIRSVHVRTLVSLSSSTATLQQG
ncbi:unnamed protein product [Brassica rapa subsp. narinosa]